MHVSLVAGAVAGAALEPGDLRGSSANPMLPVNARFCVLSERPAGARSRWDVRGVAYCQHSCRASGVPQAAAGTRDNPGNRSNGMEVKGEHRPGTGPADVAPAGADPRGLLLRAGGVR